MPSDSLCLLSLDGGGVRGLSTLYILRDIMVALNDAREQAGLPSAKPCDVFDLIGGTSTGGLIAIMLGRLKMDVDDCIKAYTELIETIFRKKQSRTGLGLRTNIEARFSSKKLQEAIESVLEKQGVSLDEAFNDGQTDISRGCRVFVCSSDRSNSRRIIRLRSYDIPGRTSPMDPPKIVEAALATSAAPTLFDEIKIDNIIHLDGGLGANNPVKQVALEACDIWFKERGEIDLQANVKCFLSIGTGHPGITRVRTEKVFSFLTETLVKMATDTEKTAIEFEDSWRAPLDNRRYFRFNVQHGLQDVGLEEYNMKGEIQSATEAYLEERANRLYVRDCIKALKDKQSIDMAQLQLYHPLRFQRISKRWGLVYGEKLCENIFERISDYDPDYHLQLITDRKCPRTTSWIISDTIYHKWREDESGYFWLTGKIGSGKTFITTAVIENLSQNGFVGHYFFQPTQSAKLDAMHLFRSYVLQIIAYLDLQDLTYLQSTVASITHLFGPQASSPTLQAISSHVLIPLHKALSKHFPTFYVLDGLDACNQEEVSNILRTFRQIANTTGCHIFISARDEMINRADLTGSHLLQLSKHHTHTDIRKFVAWKMEEKRQSDGILTSNEPLLASISQMLNEKAHLMILWVSLQIDAIWDCAGASDNEIRGILADLPRDLDETYRRCIKRVKNPLGSRVISYVYATLNPLHAEQLRGLLAIDQGSGRLDKSRLPELRSILKSCAGLISYSQTNDSVVPAHHSAVLFFQKELDHVYLLKGTSCMDTYRLALGILCVRHLTGPDYTLQISTSSMSTVPLYFDANTIAGNVYRNLHLPALPGFLQPRAAKPVNVMKRLVLKPQESGFPPIFHFARENWAPLTQLIDRTSPCWPLFRGLVLEQGRSWNLQPWKPLGQSLNSHYQGLLGWSIAKSHQPMLNVLLHDCDIKPREEIFTLPLLHYNDKLPLVLSVCIGSVVIYKMLLPHCYQAGNILLQKLLLIEAASSGFTEVLMQCIAETWFESLKNWHIDESPLVIAAENGNEEFFRKLYFSDFARSSHVQNMEALSRAFQNGHSNIVRILLDPQELLLPYWTFPSRIVGTELRGLIDQASASNHSDSKRAVYTAVAHVFRKKLADRPYFSIEEILSWVGPSLHTDAAMPLQQAIASALNDAAEEGDTLLARKLMKPFSSAPAPEDNMIFLRKAANKSMNIAISKKNVRMVEDFLKIGGVDPNTLTEGGLALHVAVKYQNVPIIQMLLKHGANQHTFGQDTLLHTAIDRGWTDMIPDLFDVWIPPDINVRDSRGRTPLMAASERCLSSIVNLLLDKGALINERSTDQGWTALMYACAAVSEPMTQGFANHAEPSIRSLCSSGAHLDARYNGGVTAFMLAAQELKLARLQTLVRYGADIHCRANDMEMHYYQWNALAFALYNEESSPRRDECIRFLVDQGLSLQSSNLGFVRLRRMLLTAQQYQRRRLAELSMHVPTYADPYFVAEVSDLSDLNNYLGEYNWTQQLIKSKIRERRESGVLRDLSGTVGNVIFELEA